MSVFVIGDVHGYLAPLQALIEQVAPGRNDVLVQLGDCINRGPESFEVVEYWLGFDRCPFYVLGGNHEELMFDYLSEAANSILEYGGEATVESYRRHGWECRRGDPQSIPDEHFQFYLQTLPWTRALLKTSRFIFTHAGYDLRARQQDPVVLRWGRVRGWSEGMPVVVRGHTPHRTVHWGRGSIEVDTGCGFPGGRLACLELESRKVIYQDAPLK